MDKKSANRKIKFAVVILSLLLYAALACTTTETGRKGAPRKETPTDASLAARTFARNCAVCHKADGTGQTLNGTAIPSLKAERARHASDEQLHTQIANGGNGMPGFFGILSGREIKELVVYIRTEIQQGERPSR